MKSEFEKWCDNYGIFHYRNLDEKKLKSYRLYVPEGIEITKYFLNQELDVLVEMGVIDSWEKCFNPQEYKIYWIAKK